MTVYMCTSWSSVHVYCKQHNTWPAAKTPRTHYFKTTCLIPRFPYSSNQLGTGPLGAPAVNPLTPVDCGVGPPWIGIAALL